MAKKKNNPKIKRRFGNVPIPQSKEFLTSIAQYLFNVDRHISEQSISNIVYYHELIKDEECGVLEHNLKRIIKVISALRDEGVTTYNLLRSELLTHTIDKKVEDEINNILDTYIMDKSEIKYITNKVKEIVDYHHVFDFLDEATELGEMLTCGDYSSMKEVTMEVLGKVDKFTEVVQSVDEADKVLINMTSPEAIDYIKDAKEHATSSRALLRTGIRALNDALGGGFEPGRFYIFGAPPKGYKTVLAKNFVEQLRKFNTYTCEETNMVPAILFVFNETSVRETVQRDFLSNSNKNMGDVDVANSPISLVLELFANTLGYGIEEKDPSRPRVLFLKCPDGTMDYRDIRNEIKRLYRDNFKVIAVVDDYLGTKKMPMHIMEIRKQYGYLAGQAKALADEEDIPVISFHQLSREAERVVDEAKAQGVDPVNSLTGFMFSESHDIKMKVDMMFAICSNVLGGAYSIQFKSLASRYVREDASGNSNFIDHPVVDMKVLTDVDKPASISNTVPRKATVIGQQQQPMQNMQGGVPGANINFGGF